MGKKSLKRPGKLGRNDLCFCGSEIKYKHCCWPQRSDICLLPVDSSRYTPEELEGFDTSFKKHQQEEIEWQQALKDVGIYIRLIKTIGNSKMRFYVESPNTVVSIGGKTTTFHQIIVDNLRIALGEAWWDNEVAKPWDKKHYLAQCYQKLEESVRNCEIWKRESEGLGSIILNGYIKYLLNLAFDMYLLTLTSNTPPDDWMERLRSYDQFQGKRYEVAVASIFARIGCKLEYLEDHKGQPRHPEFIATLTEVSQSACVEAKTKQKPGSPNTPGDIEITASTRLNGRINDALEKETNGLPFFIFVDANIPEHLIDQGRGLHWTDRVKKGLEKDYTPKAGEPSKFNTIAVTNYSYHYDREEPSTERNAFCAVSPTPKTPFPDEALKEEGIYGEFNKRIVLAVEGYGKTVPNL